MLSEEKLDLKFIMRRTSRATLKLGLILSIVVPAVVLGFGVLVSGTRMEGKIPTVIWVIAVLSFLAGLLFFTTSISDLRHPEKHDVVKWSEFGSPDEQIALIEKDWNTTPTNRRVRFGDYFLTPNWLLQINSTDVRSYPLRYVVWAFPSSKSHSVNGVPTGTTRSVKIHNTKSKFPWSIQLFSDEAMTEFLFALQERAPWGFYGHTQTNYHGWHKDHATFLAAVSARYEAVRTGERIARPVGGFEGEPPQTEASSTQASQGRRVNPSDFDV